MTETIPKSLIPIRGEPFLEHQLKLLFRRGIREAVLCVGFLGEMIRDFAADGSSFGLRLAYSFDGDMPRGTAGAVQNALPLLPKRFFVLYGDSYLDCDYAAIAKQFEASAKRGLMTIFRNDGLFDASNVQAKGGLILEYDKKRRTTEMHHIDYGVGVFERTVFEDLSRGEPVDLAEVYQTLLREGQLAAFEVERRFYEIGSFEGIRDLECYLAGGEERISAQ